MARSGLQVGYFGILEDRYDVLVEAEVSQISSWLAANPQFVEAEALRVDQHVTAGADEEHQKSWARVFRFPETSWTQVLCPRTSTAKPFAIAHRLSSDFGIRSLQIEVTEGAWMGYIFFDRGIVREASIMCMGADFQELAEEFGMPVPEIDEDDEEALYNDGDWFYSETRSRTNSPDDPLWGLTRNYRKDLDKLAKKLNIWIDEGSPVWDSTQVIERMDLLYRVAPRTLARKKPQL